MLSAFHLHFVYMVVASGCAEPIVSLKINMTRWFHIKICINLQNHPAVILVA